MYPSRIRRYANLDASKRLGGITCLTESIMCRGTISWSKPECCCHTDTIRGHLTCMAQHGEPGLSPCAESYRSRCNSVCSLSMWTTTVRDGYRHYARLILSATVLHAFAFQKSYGEDLAYGFRVLLDDLYDYMSVGSDARRKMSIIYDPIHNSMGMLWPQKALGNISWYIVVRVDQELLCSKPSNGRVMKVRIDLKGQARRQRERTKSGLCRHDCRPSRQVSSMPNGKILLLLHKSMLLWSCHCKKQLLLTSHMVLCYCDLRLPRTTCFLWQLSCQTSSFVCSYHEIPSLLVLNFPLTWTKLGDLVQLWDGCHVGIQHL